MRKLLFLSVLVLFPMIGNASSIYIIQPETKGSASSLEVSPYQDGFLESLFWKKKPVPKKSQPSSISALYAHAISNEGEWIHLRFKFLAPLSRIEIQSVGSDLNILEAYTLNNEGRKTTLTSLISPTPLPAPSKRSAEDLNQLGRLRSVVLRVQSLNQLAGVGIIVYINDSPYLLDWERTSQRPK